MTYAEALKADDVVYLGDAWAVLAYLGDALGVWTATVPMRSIA